jgi:hypothetical protein
MNGSFVQLLAKFPVRHQSGRRHASGIKHGIFVKTSITSRLGITMNSRCNIGATRRGQGALANAPDLRGEDQTRGGLLGSQERAKEPPRRNPAMSIYRFRALKVSPGRKHHGIVTKTQTNTGATDGASTAAGAVARNAAERQAQLRHAPREASSALARPVSKADGVQPGDACPPGGASFIPRRSGKRPPEVDDPSSWESGWN